jgi:hypothetical protein
MLIIYSFIMGLYISDFSPYYIALPDSEQMYLNLYLFIIREDFIIVFFHL